MFRSVAILEDHHLARLLFAVLQQAGFHPAPVEEAPSIMDHQRCLVVEVPDAEYEAARAFLRTTPYRRHVIDR